MVNILDEGYDVVLRIGRLDDSSLVACKLCDVRIVLAVLPDYLLRRVKPSQPSDFRVHDCIVNTNFRDPNWPFGSNGDDGAVSISINSHLHLATVAACLYAAMSA